MLAGAIPFLFLGGTVCFGSLSLTCFLCVFCFFAFREGGFLLFGRRRSAIFDCCHFWGTIFSGRFLERGVSSAAGDCVLVVGGGRKYNCLVRILFLGYYLWLALWRSPRSEDASLRASPRRREDAKLWSFRASGSEMCVRGKASLLKAVGLCV